jgi:beta-mannosidase
VEDLQNEKVDLFVTSDLQEAAKGQLSWRVTTVAGDTVASGKSRIDVAPLKSTNCGSVSLSKLLRKWQARDLLVWLSLDMGEKTVSENLVLLARPKHLELEQPTFQREIQALGDGTVSVRLSTDRPALWTWVELSAGDARVSDNFFDLAPGKAKEITVIPEKAMSAKDLEKRLKVRSLAEMY